MGAMRCGPANPRALPAPDPAMRSLRHIGVGCLAVALAISSLGTVTTGLVNAWVLDQDADMRSRLVEYTWFREGLYPNRWLEPGVPGAARMPYTVYPPYSLTMLVPFFEPFGKPQGRIVILVLSLAGLATIAAYGFRLLRPAGTAAALVGALAAAAVRANSGALANGQFSLICAGFVALQMTMLDRGHPLAAGLCWALAMLKPQIGLAFAALFIMRREWRGLALGLAILVALSLAACWWTSTSPWDVCDYWLYRMSMRFAAATAPGRLAEAMKLTPRVVHFGGAVLLGLMPLAALARGRSTRLLGADTLTVAAAAALLGRILLYHGVYDDIMVFPLLLLALVEAARRRTTLHLLIAAAMGMSLWLPYRLTRDVPQAWLLRPMIWSVCAAIMFGCALRTAAAPPPPRRAGRPEHDGLVAEHPSAG